MSVQIQLRRDTAVNWTSNNPTLAAGEFGLETDTTYLKIGDGSTAWTSLSYWIESNPARTVIVSSSGGDYTTIQAALTANATTDTMFVVYPGTYANDTIVFTANNQYVVGAQNVAPKVVLVTNSTNICDVGAFTGCIVKDIKMIMTCAVNQVDTTVKGTGSCNFKHCHIECIVSGANADTNGGATAFRGTGTFKIVDGSIVYTNDANRTARGKKAILVEAGSDWSIDKVAITCTGSGTSSAHAIIRDNSNGELLIENSTAEITDNETTVTYGLNIDVGAGEPEVYRNTIHVNNSTGNAIAVRVGSTSTLSVRSMYNHYHAVAGSGTAYYLQIDDANTTAISQFDDLLADDGSNIVAGTYTYVNSQTDGNLSVSGTIIGSGQTKITENLTLTGTNITNKYVDLAHTPTDNSAVGVFPVGGVKQLYTTDFTVITDGSDVLRLNWDGLGLESLLSENDIISADYIY